MSVAGTGDVTVAGLLEVIREAGYPPEPSWDGDTTLAEIRAMCGDFTLMMLVAHVEQATSSRGVWPIELIEACDTLGMLADFALVRT